MGSSELEPGAIFAKDFRIVRPLRVGGMGAVYVVDQLSTGKQRALKVMISELAQNPEIRDRFVLEAKAASRIESDHVVEIVTAGVDEESGRLYLVMELLRGEDLGDALERTGPLPAADVAEVLSQVGHALAQAHQQGLVHRDLKPENVFLSVSRRKDVAFTAKVLDFGIAKLVEDGRQKTGTQPLGSPLFMAPEQTDRKGRICPATDVWALGLIAFTLLVGKSYWREAEDGSLASLLREICVDPLSPASERAAELGGTLPEGFDAWFARCVTRDVDARFQDAGAAVDAFVALVPAGPVERKLVAQIAAGSGVGAGSTGAPIGASTTGGVVSSRSGAAAFDATAIDPATGAGARAPLAVPTVTAGVVPTPGGSASSTRIFAALAALVVGGAAAGIFLSRGGSKTTAGSATAAPLPTTSPSAQSVSASAAPVGGSCPAGMIFHPAGSMVMGAKDGSPDAQPVHKVTLHAFCLDKTEVTAAAFDGCVSSSECEKPPNDVSYKGVTDEARAKYRELCTARNKDLADHPINCVDWKQADQYCRWKKGRLPTEAEWEYAARGSSQRDFPWGDDPPNEKRLNACGAECATWGRAHDVDLKTMFEGDDHFPATAPVGSFPGGASSLGVLDLAGNVWEWTADWYGPYTGEASTDPKGPKEGTERVVRGGAFNGAMVDWAKPSYRWKSGPDTYNHAIGFRCAADPTG
jgi:formylglycine-generating enzyme required for sulfatase activity/tRNA A-37 threonylcarbamoyl transferase component Bud32